MRFARNAVLQTGRQCEFLGETRSVFGFRMPLPIRARWREGKYTREDYLALLPDGRLFIDSEPTDTSGLFGTRRASSPVHCRPGPSK